LISPFRKNRTENKFFGKIDFKVIEVKEIGKEWYRIKQKAIEII